MAQLESEITFTGSFGGLSAYRMKGSAKIILRSKGGAKKERIKNDPVFVQTRRNNAEFGARSLMSRCITRAMNSVRWLADYNMSGPLNAFLRPLQKMDGVSEWGKRCIRLSMNPAYLEGFSLNRKVPFDQVVRTPLKVTLDRATCRATLKLPALIPDINFLPQTKLPRFRIIASLAVVPDVIWTEAGYKPTHDYNTLDVQDAFTEWYPVQQGAEASIMTLQIAALPAEHCSLMLTIGICYGALTDTGEIEFVKYAGSAKVLAMG